MNSINCYEETATATLGGDNVNKDSSRASRARSPESTWNPGRASRSAVRLKVINVGLLDFALPPLRCFRRSVSPLSVDSSFYI